VREWAKVVDGVWGQVWGQMWAGGVHGWSTDMA
jgi:hypothetical protein